MQSVSSLKTIPDDELLHRLAALLAGSRHAEADLVAHIGEVDARRLYAREATPSMFVYCLERLHLSEREAYLRIAAARASREHPVILDMLADGRLHLTGIALLASHLTRENRDALLERATHKTKREIEELLAELAPRPDVRPSIRRLPLGRVVASTAPCERAATAVNPPPGAVSPSPEAASSPPVPARPASHGVAALLGLRPEQVDSDASGGLGALASGTGATEATHVSGPGAEGEPATETAPASSSEADLVVRWAARGGFQPARIEPLSPSRYRVQFTASAELRDKLERLKDLMRSAVPDGDLAAIIDAAVTEKLERLEARRFGRTKAPRKDLADTNTAPSTRHVPAATRRAVHERDEGRCRYVDAQGRRCTARVVQFHHGHPFGAGGDHSLSNVRLLCEGHNQYLARIDFGAEAIAKHHRGSA
jgi:hypothetical protein